MAFGSLHPASDLEGGEMESRDQLVNPGEWAPTEGEIQDLKLLVRNGGFIDVERSARTTRRTIYPNAR